MCDASRWLDLLSELRDHFPGPTYHVWGDLSGELRYVLSIAGGTYYIDDIAALNEDYPDVKSWLVLFREFLHKILRAKVVASEVEYHI